MVYFPPDTGVWVVTAEFYIAAKAILGHPLAYGSL